MLRKSVYITDSFDVAIDEDTYIKIRLGVAARSVRSSRPHRSMKGSIPQTKQMIQRSVYITLIDNVWRFPVPLGRFVGRKVSAMIHVP